MQTPFIHVIRIQYNALTGLAWIMFWAFLAFFVAVMLQWSTLESRTAHWWWIASAVLITLRKPFKTVTILRIKLPLNTKDSAP